MLRKGIPRPLASSPSEEWFPCLSSHTHLLELDEGGQELEAITAHQSHLPSNSTKPTFKNAYKCVILRGEHSELRATPKEEQCSRPHFRNSTGLSEHGPENGAWWTVPWGDTREAPGKNKAEGLLPRVSFVPRVVLGCDFVPPVLSIYIQFTRNVYPCWMSEHSYRTQSGQCALKMDITFCLAFMFSQI